MRAAVSSAVAFATAMVLFASQVVAQESADTSPGVPHAIERQAIEFSPLSPVIRIYAVQYSREVRDRTELIVGAAYTNIQYDQGRSHAPTAIVGARQYLWRQAHVEYQLWPSYNWYYEEVEKRHYNGPELWNEFRAGYTFDIGRSPLFVNVQYLVGFALYGGNKPQSFKDQADREGLFTVPMVFMGWRF